MIFGAVLRMRGWMVFVILFAAALLGFGSMFVPVFTLGRRPPPPPLVFGVAVALMEFLYFGWAWAVGAAMNSRLPRALRRRYALPATGLLIATGYSCWFATGFATPFEPRSMGPVPVTLHFTSMAVNFYLLWYVSRALVAAEEGGKPPLDRTLGLFFVLWFSMIVPIGAWWAQERARVVASGLPPLSDSHLGRD